MTNAFVLTDNSGQIKDRDMLDLYDGYLELGYTIKFFKASDLYINPKLISKEDIFCGHVDLCRQIMINNKVEEPYISTYPDDLKEFFGRKIKKSTIREIKKYLLENEENGILKSYFIKPLKNKLFTGYVVSFLQDLNKIQCSNSTEIWISNVVNFGAEFRCYIYKNQVVDAFRYWGDDWGAILNKQIVETMVSKLKNMPIFYSLDVGINNDTKELLLLEINDGYALGNYGLGTKQYAEMSANRWKEIMNWSEINY